MLVFNFGAIATGILLYLLLCFIAIVAGCALLRLFQIKVSSGFLLLAPVATLSFWSLALGIAGGLRIPIKEIWFLVWGITLFLAFVGVRRCWIELQSGYLFMVICILLPILTMPSYFLNGLIDYLGSVLPDGWSYIAFGQYLWEYPRGAQGGLAPLYQYAAHLSNTRFVSAGLLGFFSPLVRIGDTQAASNLFQAWALFSMACAVALYWATEKQSTKLSVVATILSVLAGWTVNLVWANNFDNQLALAYLPAFAAMANFLVVEKRRWWLLFALFSAALLYTYPELAIIILGCAAFFVVTRLWEEKHAPKTYIQGGVIALGAVFLFLLPIQNLLPVFLLGQFQSALSAAGRPGEGLFPGLAEYNFLPAAIWGLGSEQGFFRSIVGVLDGVGIALTLVATAGAIVLGRQRRWGLVLTLISLTAVSIYYIVIQRYSYAAYKIILLNWWCLAGVLIVGTDYILNRLRFSSKAIALALGLGIIFFGVDAHERAIYYRDQSLELSQFSTVNQVKEISHGGPIQILVDDWIANEWAVYYLRDIPVSLTEYRMYMAQAHVVPFMQNASRIDPHIIHYFLTDSKFSAQEAASRGWDKKWADGAYLLWQSE